MYSFFNKNKIYTRSNHLTICIWWKGITAIGSTNFFMKGLNADIIFRNRKHKSFTTKIPYFEKTSATMASPKSSPAFTFKSVMSPKNSPTSLVEFIDVWASSWLLESLYNFTLKEPITGTFKPNFVMVPFAKGLNRNPYSHTSVAFL